MWLLIKDAWHTQNWKDKFRIWFMPTGWRPADVALKFPVYKIEDVYNFEKYNTKGSTIFATWIWVQMLMLLLFVSYLFGNIATIGSPDIFLYGGFIFIFVYAFTELMDRNKYAIVWEILKAVLGIYIITSSGDWFGSNKFYPGISTILIAYFLLSIAVSAWLAFSTNNETNTFSVATE